MVMLPERKTRTEYSLQAYFDTAELNLNVNHRLQDGWSLYGSPSVSVSGHSVVYSQAVYRIVEVP